MEMLTEQDLTTIEGRAAKATEGPWAGVGQGPTSIVESRNCTVFTDTYIDDADLVFIAHARTDVPALVAEVRRLRAILPSGDRGAVPLDMTALGFVRNRKLMTHLAPPISVLSEHVTPPRSPDGT